MKTNINYKKYIIGALLGIGSTICAICLFAALMLVLKMDRAYASFFATISVSVGAYISAFYISRKTGEKGYFVGFLTGSAYFAFITLLSLIITKSHISSNTAFHFVIVILSATVGGIFGVNKKKSKIL